MDIIREREFAMRYKVGKNEGGGGFGSFGLGQRGWHRKNEIEGKVNEEGENIKKKVFPTSGGTCVKNIESLYLKKREQEI